MRIFLVCLFCSFTLQNYQFGVSAATSGGICHRTDQIVTYVSTEVIMAKLGTQTQLYCCIINSDFLGWVFLNNKVESSARHVMSYERDTGAQILSLNNVKESDAGTYYCRVNVHGREIRDFPVQVNIKAEATLTSPTFYLEISKTERIPLKIMGLPFPTVHLYRIDSEIPLIENYVSHQAIRNGRYQIVSDGDIIISNLMPSDSGKYTIRLNQGSSQLPDEYHIEIRAGAPPFVAYFPKPVMNFTLTQNEVIPTRFSGELLNIYWRFTSDVSGERTDRIIGDTDSHYYVSVDGSLNVINVVNSDAGTYTGVCKNPWGEAQVSTVVIRTIRAAKIEKLNNQVGAVGGNVTFEVEITGSPPPYISWWRNSVELKGTRISNTKSTLTLSLLTRNDAGEYQCIVDNGASTNGKRSWATKTFMLYIEGFPIMNLKKSRTILVVTENRKLVELRCVVNGLPYPDITFIKGKQTFAPDARLTGQKNKDTYEATLLMTIETQEQIGNYTCRAINAYGTSELVIGVMYMDIPAPPKNLHILQLDRNAVKIVWDLAERSAISDTTSYLATLWTEFHLSTVSKSVHSTSVTFTSLKAGVRYYFSVRASNLAGWSNPSSVIFFTTPEVGRPSPPQILNREIFLRSSMFRLYWEGPMDNGGDDEITYNVRKCLWEVERIQLDKNCESFQRIRSNEIFFDGLIGFQLYNFYVSAVNSLGTSDEAKYQVFSGSNPSIGTPGPVSPETIALLTILFTLLLLLLIDLLLLAFLRTGFIYWLLSMCFFPGTCVSEEEIPLRKDSLLPVKTRADAYAVDSGYTPIYERDSERVETTDYALLEDQVYQEIIDSQASSYAPRSDPRERAFVDFSNSGYKNLRYSAVDEKVLIDTEPNRRGQTGTKNRETGVQRKIDELQETVFLDTDGEVLGSGVDGQGKELRRVQTQKPSILVDFAGRKERGKGGIEPKLRGASRVNPNELRSIAGQPNRTQTDSESFPSEISGPPLRNITEVKETFYSKLEPKGDSRGVSIGASSTINEKERTVSPNLVFVEKQETKKERDFEPKYDGPDMVL